MDNVEVVRRIWDHWSRGAESGDPAHGRAVFDEGLVAPDFRFTPLTELAGVGGTTYVGKEGMREFVTTWTAEWRDWRLELEEVSELGSDHVLAVFRQSATGRRSGVHAEIQLATVFVFDRGQVVEHRHYRERAEAMEALGGQAGRLGGPNP